MLFFFFFLIHEALIPIGFFFFLLSDSAPPQHCHLPLPLLPVLEFSINLFSQHLLFQTYHYSPFIPYYFFHSNRSKQHLPTQYKKPQQSTSQVLNLSPTMVKNSTSTILRALLSQGCYHISEGLLIQCPSVVRPLSHPSCQFTAEIQFLIPMWSLGVAPLLLLSKLGTGVSQSGQDPRGILRIGPLSQTTFLDFSQLGKVFPHSFLLNNCLYIAILSTSLQSVMII